MQHIIECLTSMPECLRNLDLRSVLTNGKVEAQLKTFLGISWVADNPRGRAYLMDERFGLPGGFDLVAFEDLEPRFWIETKCDFAADRARAERSARDALRQVDRYTSHDSLPGDLRECPAYIVHFLCSLPSEGQYPGWASGPFDKHRVSEGDGRRLTGLELRSLYREIDSKNLKRIYRTKHLQIRFDTGKLDAVVVKMQKGE